MAELKAGLYDFDGCLVDSEQFNIGLIIPALKSLGQVRSDKEIKHAMTYPWKECVQALIPGIVGEKLKQFMDEVRLFERENIDQLKLFPGVLETLDAHRRQNLSLAIVSNRESSIHRLMMAVGLKDYFPVVVSRDTVQKPKPDPESVFQALEKLNVLPRFAFGVGDSISDIEAYKLAGLGLTIGVSHGYFGEKILEAKPDFVVNSFVQIKKIIHGLHF